MNDELARVEVADEDGFAVAHIWGEIDLSNARDIEASLAAHSDGCPVFIVDLSDLTFLDSSGCALLDRTAVRLRQADRELRLIVRPGAIIERTLELAGLSNTIAVHPDKRSATSG